MQRAARRKAIRHRRRTVGRIRGRHDLVEGVLLQLLLLLLKSVLLRELCPVIVHSCRIEVGSIDVVENWGWLRTNHAANGTTNH
jgi:hypothetical protein